MSSAPSSADSERPRYPLDRSFVVQIELGCRAGEDRLIGRVEHVSSGETVLFSNDRALLSFIQAVLGGATPIP